MAQSRLANSFGASPLWPDVHKMFFRFPVTWCCTNVGMSCLDLDCLWCICFYTQKQALCFSVVWAEEEKPFKFGNYKIQSSIFPGTFRSSSVCRDGVLITKDAVLQRKVSKNFKQQRKEAKLALTLLFHSKHAK